MEWSAFFPNNFLALTFVFALILWFAAWVFRFRKETEWTQALWRSVDAMDECIEQLRAQLLWRDRQRIKGQDAPADPAQFFDKTVETVFKLRNGPLPPVAAQTHFKTIFVAGCDESMLDSTELTAATLQELGRRSNQLWLELVLMLLFGAFGALLTLFSSTRSNLETALPPLIWGTLFALTGGGLFLRFRFTVQARSFFNLRRKTTTLWIPKLYPTVAQRAAQWAVQTLQNAARVTDASAVIETRTVEFVNAVSNARQAAEMFAQGMREFSQGIAASDHALERAQASLGSEIEKFADSLRRWTAFEDEIRTFYRSVEAHQAQLVEERKTLEYMLSGYRDFVRQATGVLEKSASRVGEAADLLPGAFNTAADRMTQISAELQNTMAELLKNLASELQSVARQDSMEMGERLQTIAGPVLSMEDRLRTLSVPFERTANNFTEIATNLWKLNDSFAREVTRALAAKQGSDSGASTGNQR
jgi:hypothetical protein